MKPRWKITLIKRQGEVIKYMHTLKFFDKDFAKNVGAAFEDEWEVILDEIEHKTMHVMQRENAAD